MNRALLNKKTFTHSFLPKYKSSLLLNTMRWHSTVTVENSVSNNNDRLRLMEDEYCCDHSTPFPPLIETTLNQLAINTIHEFRNAHMMNTKTSAKFLSQWIHILKPNNVLEIGTFTGYSTIAMASALKEKKGHLYSLESDSVPLKMAQEYINQAQLMDKVTLIEGDATESLLSFVKDKIQFDMIFLDADKGGYIKYFDTILDNNLLADDGILLADNALYFGQVHRVSGYEEGEQEASPSQNIKKKAIQVAAFNKHVKEDPRVQVTILPVFDGLSIIQKKKQS